MDYDRLFDPSAHEAVGAQDVWDRLPKPKGDQAAPDKYVYSDEIELAVNVALATGRPLLVRGEPGSGKSSLARAVAHRCGWDFCEQVVTSKSSARDLQWSFDALRRLNDAHAGTLVDLAKAHDMSEAERKARTICPYIEPGVLWWAFQADTARRRGAEVDVKGAVEPHYPGTTNGGDRTVILIDEIDKADPDLPNDLLVALGSRRFRVADLGLEVVRGDTTPFVVITTNRERSLPQAFLRRCVILDLPTPVKSRLKSIATAHYPTLSDDLFKALFEQYDAFRGRAEKHKVRAPGIAEFLDAVRACIQLNVADESNEAWQKVLDSTMWKHERDGAKKA